MLAIAYILGVITGIVILGAYILLSDWPVGPRF